MDYKSVQFAIAIYENFLASFQADIVKKSTSIKAGITANKVLVLFMNV